MEYMAVRWNQPSADMPVEIYSELDGRRMEVRKVEVFPDGSMGYASLTGPSSPRTALGIEPVPPASSIGPQSEFQPRPITKGEFETLWQAATRKGRA